MASFFGRIGSGETPHAAARNEEREFAGSRAAVAERGLLTDRRHGSVFRQRVSGSGRWLSLPSLLLVLCLLPLRAGAQGGSTGGPGVAAKSDTLPVVAVSILPQAEFVDRIAGGTVKVLTLVGPGASPHSYEPTPRQMADLSKAQIWFTVGVEFENALLPKVKSLYPKMKIVDTTKNVKFRMLEAHNDEEDEKSGANNGANGAAGSVPGDSEEHEGESGVDPHTWLGHDAAKKEISAILETLVAAFPSNAAYYRDNYSRYIAEIDSVFARLAKELAPYRGTTVYVYHPSFGYFLDNFGIAQEAVETGGKEPTQKNLAALIKRAQKDKIKVVFVQKQFSKTAAQAVAAAIGGRVVEIDPLAPNWLKNIEIMGRAITMSEAK